MLVQKFSTQKTKNIIFTLVILLLIASNLATLLSWRAHEAMHNVMSQTLGFFSTELAKKVLLKSPKVYFEMNVESRSKIMTNKLQNDLKEMSDKEQKARQKLRTNGVNAQLAVQSIEKRIRRNLIRNLAALSSESIPAVSLGVSAAVTGMDIYDACETMKEFNSVLVAMEQAPVTTDVCSFAIPTTDSLKAIFNANWMSRLNPFTN